MKLHGFVSVLAAFFLVSKTKWSSYLHLVVLFPFLLFCVHFLFFHSFQKDQKPDTTKTKQNAEKRTNNSIGAVVFANSVPIFWDGLKNALFAENPIKIVVSEYFEKGKKCQTYEKGWVKNLSKYVAQHNWTDVWLKNMVILCLFYSHSPCRKKTIFEKQIRKNEEQLDRVWLKKGKLLDRLLTLQHIYIYTL